MEGFAEQQKGRPLAHLVKELLQNALDEVEGQGSIELTIARKDKATYSVLCVDDGHGAADLSKISVMFHTTKKDSALQRGRMGRGFKELLSVSSYAAVESRGQRRVFTHDQNGPITIYEHLSAPSQSGFAVLMDVVHSDRLEEVVSYFNCFLLQAGISFRINGCLIRTREAARAIDASLTTELFEGGVWRKRDRATTVRLVPTVSTEEAMIYEMGIPVCPVRWTELYHCDVQQRVPMNPNRDAVVEGYAEALRAACLPALIGEFSRERALAPWVSDAVTHKYYSADEAQRARTRTIMEILVRTAYGEQVARSVPSEGKYDFDAVAAEKGFEVVQVAHLQYSLRDILKEVVPTSKEVVNQARRRQWAQAKSVSLSVEGVLALAFGADEANGPAGYMQAIAHHGKERIVDRMRFALWFAEGLLRLRELEGVKVEVRCGWLSGTTIATWSDANVLSLSLAYDNVWSLRMDRHFLSLVVHEAAHSQALHHGWSFVTEVERCAGAGAMLMLGTSSDWLLQEFPTLFTESPFNPEALIYSDAWNGRAKKAGRYWRIVP